MWAVDIARSQDGYRKPARGVEGAGEDIACGLACFLDSKPPQGCAFVRWLIPRLTVDLVG